MRQFGAESSNIAGVAPVEFAIPNQCRPDVSTATLQICRDGAVSQLPLNLRDRGAAELGRKEVLRSGCGMTREVNEHRFRRSGPPAEANHGTLAVRRTF